MINNANPNEYLLVLGITGTIIILIESLPLELTYIKNISTVLQILNYIGFGISLICMYSIAPYYFKNYSATMYNLSLLTTMVYGLILGIFIFEESFSYLYFAGFLVVIVGIIVHNLQASNNGIEKTGENDKLMEEINDTREALI